MKAVKSKPTKATSPPPVMATIPPAADGLLTKDQVAALLGISVSLFKQMVSAEDYPKPDLRLGRGKLPRWHVATHNAWLAAKCGRGGA